MKDWIIYIFKCFVLGYVVGGLIKRWSKKL